MILKVGKSISLYCSGVGKSLLSEMDSTRVKQIRNSSKIQTLTPHTITEYNAFYTRLEQIKKQSYALDDEANELDVYCITGCIKDH